MEAPEAPEDPGIEEEPGGGDLGDEEGDLGDEGGELGDEGDEEPVEGSDDF